MQTPRMLFLSSASYATRKRKLVLKFVQALKDKKTYNDKSLVRTKNLPTFFPMSDVKVLFVMLGEGEDKRKKVLVLTDILIDWVGSKRKTDCGFPSPATINSDVNAFFAATKNFFDWNYYHANFNFDRGYNGFFSSVNADWQKVDVSSPLFYFTCLWLLS